jgi:hypothetical protein
MFAKLTLELAFEFYMSIDYQYSLVNKLTTILILNEQ